MKKYQVFVSSTYEDLKEERAAVVRSILEMGHIPVGMEMFSAADDEQWRIITSHIDLSDYYVVLLAHRYGSIAEQEASYTRKEYEYARSKGIPVLGFLLADGIQWPPDHVDKEPAATRALEAFKERVKEKPVAFWTSPEDLHGKCAVALMKAITANPREGWTRTHEAANPEVTSELTRLSAENAQLRRQLADAATSAEADETEHLKMLLRALTENKQMFDFKRTSVDDWQRSSEHTLMEIFFWLGPSLMSEATVDDLSDSMAMNAAGDPPWHLVAMNQVRDILADLASLDLVEPSKKKHSVNDYSEYWSLTETGLAMLRWDRKEWLLSGNKSAEPADPADEEEPVGKVEAKLPPDGGEGSPANSDPPDA